MCFVQLGLGRCCHVSGDVIAELADRSRDEQKMFGGLCFMLRGTMCCGLRNDDMTVRVGPDAYASALAEPHVRPMDITGRPLVGLVYVAPEGVRSAASLAKWIERGVTFVSSLPPKKAKTKPAKARTKAEPKARATPKAKATPKPKPKGKANTAAKRASKR